MKKGILIFGGALMVFSLTAFSFIKWNSSTITTDEVLIKVVEESDFDFKVLFNNEVKPGFHYDVASRFNTTITKEKLFNAKSIIDLVPIEATAGLDSFREVKIVLHSKCKNKYEEGVNDKLNSRQIKLLHSMNYSTSFNIEAFCKYTNADTGKTEDYCFVYYITVIPEHQTKFQQGHKELLNYLMIKSAKAVENTQIDQLKSGKIQFTIAKNGTVSKVILESTSGYDSIDDKMIELIKMMPGKWKPARNSFGEKVEQELVYSFGMIGC